MKTSKSVSHFRKMCFLMIVIALAGSCCFAEGTTGLASLGTLINTILALLTSSYVKGIVAIVCGITGIVALVNKGDQQLFMKYGKIALCCALILSCQWLAGLFFSTKDTTYSMAPDYTTLTK